MIQMRKGRLRYAFGDSEIAAARLEMVARVFEPATRALLREADPAERNLAIDLGCGPGHTTALLAEVLRCRHTVGLDFSAEFIERARRFASDSVAFYVHDVTVVPFPVGLADLLYCRFLLTHLRDPARVVARWAEQLVSGGVLAVEEVESITTNSPALKRYLEILDQMLRSQSNQLYIGSELEGARVSRSLAKWKSGILEFPVFPADAAAMFALNLRTWRDHPFVREHVEEQEIERLERDLDAVRSHAPTGVGIVWKLRHLVYRRA
jgi:SAM-dependent methyltransferase